MESKVANISRKALMEDYKKMTHEERLEAYINLYRQIFEIHSKGKQLREES